MALVTTGTVQARQLFLNSLSTDVVLAELMPDSSSNPSLIWPHFPAAAVSRPASPSLSTNIAIITVVNPVNKVRGNASLPPLFFRVFKHEICVQSLEKYRVGVMTRLPVSVTGMLLPLNVEKDAQIV
jgi:hypothetical protein